MPGAPPQVLRVREQHGPAVVVAARGRARPGRRRAVAAGTTTRQLLVGGHDDRPSGIHGRLRRHRHRHTSEDWTVSRTVVRARGG